MRSRRLALFYAALILIVALIMELAGASDAMSFAAIIAITALALGHGRESCGRSCA